MNKFILALLLVLPGVSIHAEPLRSGEEKPISLDLQDTDIRAALRMLSEIKHINLVIDREVQGRVTVRLKDVSWDEAFNTVLALRGLRAVKFETGYEIRPIR